MKYIGKIAGTMLFILIFSLLLYVGCTDSVNQIETIENGKLVVKITDAPFPIDLIEEANVTINKIEIRKADTDSAAYIVISDSVRTYNLLELRNGLTEDLPEIEIEPGSYDLIRLYVTEASILLKDGQDFTLKIPSGPQSGIKIFIQPPLVIESGVTAEILLDFDLSKSFVVQGNPKKQIKGFHFKPVIRATNALGAGSLFGEVKDTADTALASAQVWVEQDTVISTTFTNEDGSYELLGLKAGLYTAYATKEGYDTAKVSDVNIVAGSKTKQNFILTKK